MLLASKGKLIIEWKLFGEVIIEFYPKESPKVVEMFLKSILGKPAQEALNVLGKQDGLLKFSLTEGKGLESKEFHSRLRYQQRGFLGCSSRKGEEGKGEFFINLVPRDDLQHFHSIFGIIRGRNIYNLLKLWSSPVNDDGSFVHCPEIVRIELVENPFENIHIEPEFIQQKKKGVKRVKSVPKLIIDEDEDDTIPIAIQNTHDVLKEKKYSTKSLTVASKEAIHSRLEERKNQYYDDNHHMKQKIQELNFKHFSEDQSNPTETTNMKKERKKSTLKGNEHLVEHQKNYFQKRKRRKKLFSKEIKWAKPISAKKKSLNIDEEYDVCYEG